MRSMAPLRDSNWKSQFLSGLMFPMMNFISNLGYVAIVILGGFLAANNKITIGDIQAFIQYVRSFTPADHTDREYLQCVPADSRGCRTCV